MEKQHEVEANSTKEPEIASQSTKSPIEVKLTKEQKFAIAAEAHESGNFDEVAAAYHIPVKTLAVWHASYCRWRLGAKKPKPETKPLSSEMAESPSATKVDKSEPKYTKVDKGDHTGLIYLGTFEVAAAPDIELPDFPPFDSAWPEMVQLRWLDTYRELARR